MLLEQFRHRICAPAQLRTATPKHPHPIISHQPRVLETSWFDGILLFSAMDCLQLSSMSDAELRRVISYLANSIPSNSDFVYMLQP